MLFKKTTDANKVETIIGLETHFHGTVSTKGMLRVDGKIDGGISEASEVIIGTDGQIKGDISAVNIVVGGKITGNINATNQIELLPTAQIYGDIRTPQLQISEGAVFEGNCVMTTERERVIEVEVKGSQRSK
jgi:cytoskeletal protein CcmA (bactofilin family)